LCPAQYESIVTEKTLENGDRGIKSGGELQGVSISREKSNPLPVAAATRERVLQRNTFVTEGVSGQEGKLSAMRCPYLGLLMCLWGIGSNFEYGTEKEGSIRGKTKKKAKLNEK